VTIQSVSRSDSPTVTELVANAELALQSLPLSLTPRTPPPPPPPQADTEAQTPTLATISGYPRGRRSHPYSAESRQGASGLGSRSASRSLFH
jgi:hypothetical protein